MYINEFDMYSCSRCHNIFPLEEMRKDIICKNGIGYDCKYCSREYAKNYNINHKDKIEVYRKKNHDHILNSHRQYNLKNKDKIKENAKEYRLKTKKQVISYYSNGTMVCKECGYSNIDALSIDHMNGGGNKHREQLKNEGIYHFYNWLIKNNYPTDYQVLCMNCQFLKKKEEVL